VVGVPFDRTPEPLRPFRCATPAHRSSDGRDAQDWSHLLAPASAALSRAALLMLVEPLVPALLLALAVLAQYPIVFTAVFTALQFARRWTCPAGWSYEEDGREPRDVTAVTFPPAETSVG
jgi:hypothetical protein